MKLNIPGRLCPLLLALLATETPASDDVYREVIVVSASRTNSLHTDLIDGMTTPVAVADSAAIVARRPGAALINNGGLSGQVQYRGVFGDRIGTTVNHQRFHSGGPNLMDPPMHYAPPTLVRAIEVSRGVADVTFGPSLVGGVNTELKSLSFTDSASLESEYDVTLIGRSVDNSHAIGLVGGLANQDLYGYGYYSREEGSEIDSPDGEIANTHHERQVYGSGMGIRTNLGELSLEVRRQETGPTGNPPFAMDIDYVDTDFANIGLKSQIGETSLALALGFSDVDHVMTNYKDRPAPPSMMRYRETRAQAETLTARAHLERHFAAGKLDYGFDLSRAELTARITNPNNPAFAVNPLPDISQDRTGGFLNWRQGNAEKEFSIGVRIDRHSSHSKTPDNGVVPPMVMSLASAQGQKDLNWEDTTVDAVIRYWWQSDAGLWRASLARKNRAPSHLERFGWLPIAASAGLADGNNYLGDVDLNPETALIAEFGVDFAGGNWWMRPSVYYHRVSDYVQGMPVDSTPETVDSMVEMISGMNGDASPLRFSNVDADMYGFDADFGIQLAERWRVEGVLSIVRSELKDTGDDLYRMSPDQLSLGLIYDRSNWSMTLEAVGIDDQQRVSRINNELASTGYGLLNLYGNWQARDGLHFSVGLENILDRDYRNHLAGYNRVRDSVVAVGERLPGQGRNFFLKISLQH